MCLEPKEDYTYRHKLFGLCLDRGISQEKMREIVAPMDGCSAAEKERLAAEIIPAVESGAFDCHPRHFYQKAEWYTKIRNLFDTDSICYETVLPIVEEILSYCNISDDGIARVVSFLHTEDTLRQMYNWLMQLSYVPDEAACIIKAEEICNTR